MLKTRIILVVVAGIVSVVLFSLPTVVVENETDSLGQTQSDVSSTDPAPHNMEMDESQRQIADQLKDQLALADNTEKSINFADSLAELYLAVQFKVSHNQFHQITT